MREPCGPFDRAGTSVGRRRVRVRWPTVAWLVASCASASEGYWHASGSWGDAQRRAIAAEEAALILRDHTDLRLLAPRFDDERVRGARVSACSGSSCDAVRRTGTVPRSEVAWMSLRYASAEDVRPVTEGRARRDTPSDADLESSPAVEESRRGTAPRARHSLYLSGTSLIFSNGLGLSYGYRPLRVFAISAGAGFSSLSVPCWCFSIWGSDSCGCRRREESAAGGQVLGHLLVGGATFNLELGFGLALVVTRSELLYGRISEGLRAYPSGFLGLRIHPVGGGFLLRAGAAWEYGLATGVSLSLGAAF